MTLTCNSCCCICCSFPELSGLPDTQRRKRTPESLHRTIPGEDESMTSGGDRTLTQLCDSVQCKLHRGTAFASSCFVSFYVLLHNRVCTFSYVCCGRACLYNHLFAVLSPDSIWLTLEAPQFFLAHETTDLASFQNNIQAPSLAPWPA